LTKKQTEVIVTDSEGLKKAMENGQNPLSAAEVDFVETSFRILGIDSTEMIEVIGKKAMDRGKGQVMRVMTAITSQLDELGARVQAHKRPTPTPAMSTRTYDNMDAPARSLAHLQVCAKGLRDATVGGFSKGIKVAKMALENAQEDFQTTVKRMGEAAKWKQGFMTAGSRKARRFVGLC
jgi:hypothetical protein